MEYLNNPNDPKKEKIDEMAKFTTTEMVCMRIACNMIDCDHVIEHTQREKCWEVRDACFNCLDATHNRGKCRGVCQDFFSGEYCLQSWIRHFSNKRRYANAWEFYKKQRQDHRTQQEDQSQET
eukprot:37441_1